MVTLGRVGFCCFDVHPSGPDHESEAPLTNSAVRYNVSPTQRGELGFINGGMIPQSVIPLLLVLLNEILHG